ncbi:MAG: LD-carboxypeptidase [Prevotellaceae bacterium]|jgi:muramoyltetrapeptide carboxypeptidase|nr:LD-carboxypeptidase [Prevotellaceae bacterium]
MARIYVYFFIYNYLFFFVAADKFPNFVSLFVFFMLLNVNYLKHGYKIAVVAPAGRLAEGVLDPLLYALKRWSLHPVVGKHVYAQDYTFAGADDLRREDFQQAINNSEIKAIFCARGGYGSSRIIDDIDFSPLLKMPKLLVGFSDITVLHARWHRLGLASIHGAMSAHFPLDGQDDGTMASLRKALFGEALHYELPPHPFNCCGEVQGMLVGGNLSIIAHLTGSADEWNTEGKILFLEDINEPLYVIDRMMVHLRRSGKLNGITGLLVGQFINIKDGETPFGKTAYEIIAEQVKDLNIPVAYAFPAGHEKPNLALPFGSSMKFSVNKDFVAIDFKM